MGADKERNDCLKKRHKTTRFKEWCVTQDKQVWCDKKSGNTLLKIQTIHTNIKIQPESYKQHCIKESWKWVSTTSQWQSKANQTHHFGRKHKLNLIWSVLSVSLIIFAPTYFVFSDCFYLWGLIVCVYLNLIEVAEGHYCFLIRTKEHKDVLMGSVLPCPEESSTSRHTSYSSQGCQH